MAVGPVSYQGVPQLGVPLVNENRTVAFAWYRLFTSLASAVLQSTDPATGRVTSNPSSLTLMGLQNQVTAGDNALQAEITTLQGQVASLATAVSTLQAQVATLQGQMTAANGAIAGLQSQIDSVAFPGSTAGTANAGVSGALPAQVRSYLDLTLGGTPVKIPLYNP